MNKSSIGYSWLPLKHSYEFSWFDYEVLLEHLNVVWIYDQITVVFVSHSGHLGSKSRIVLYSEGYTMVYTLGHPMCDTFSIEFCDPGHPHIIIREYHGKTLHDSEKVLEVPVWLQESQRRCQEHLVWQVSKCFFYSTSYFVQSYIAIVIHEIKIEHTIQRIDVSLLESDYPLILCFTEHEEGIDASEDPVLQFLYILRSIYHARLSSARCARYGMGSSQFYQIRNGILCKLFRKMSEYLFFRDHLITAFTLYELTKTSFWCPHILHYFMYTDKIALCQISAMYGLYSNLFHIRVLLKSKPSFYTGRELHFCYICGGKWSYRYWLQDGNIYKYAYALHIIITLWRLLVSEDGKEPLSLQQWSYRDNQPWQTNQYPSLRALLSWRM